MADEGDWACDLAPLTITPPPSKAAAAAASGGGAAAAGGMPVAAATRSMAEVDAIVARY